MNRSPLIDGIPLAIDLEIELMIALLPLLRPSDFLDARVQLRMQYLKVYA